MSCALGSSITCYKFLYEEERQKMIDNTVFVCLNESNIIRFDKTDNSFWSFGRLQKIKLSISEVRKMPEIKLFKVDLKKIMIL
jgi:hypothetical protein